MGDTDNPNGNDSQDLNGDQQNNRQDQQQSNQYGQQDQQNQQQNNQDRQNQQNQQQYDQDRQNQQYYQHLPQLQQPRYSGQSQFQQPLYTQAPKKSYAMAVASMICGIVSLTISCCFWYISLPVSLVGLVLGILSIRNKEEGRGMAIAGIITSVITILFATLLLFGCGAYFAWIANIINNTDYNTAYY